MTAFPQVTQRQSEEMGRAAVGPVLLLLVVLVTSNAAEAADGNSTVPAGGFVPVVFTKVSQLIAREGSCVLIDCNVTGEPSPSVKWFNSHGDRLDTDASGKCVTW